MPSRSATSCAKVVSWPWPWLWVPVRTSTLPVGLTRTSADSHKPTPAPSEPTAWLGAMPQASIYVEKPKPRSLPSRSELALALRKMRDIGELERLLERGVIIAGVVIHDHRRLVRECPDEVLAPQLRRRRAELAGADLEQALDHERRLGTPGAAIGVDRHGVGIDRIDLAIDVRDVVLPRQQRRVEIGRHRGGEQSTYRRRDWRWS